MIKSSILFFIIIALSITEPFPGVSQIPGATIEQLNWISGTWIGITDERTVEEQWMNPSGKTMLGMSRIIAHKSTVEYDYLMIKQNTEGDIYYVAEPSGQKADSFKLIRYSKTEAIFENSARDFPQRIIYRLRGTDSLIVRIEGTIEAKAQGRDFPMRRTTK